MIAIPHLSEARGKIYHQAEEGVPANELEIPDGGVCTPECATGFTPSVTSFTCVDGTFIDSRHLMNRYSCNDADGTVDPLLFLT